MTATVFTLNDLCWNDTRSASVYNNLGEVAQSKTLQEAAALEEDALTSSEALKIAVELDITC